MMHIIIFSMSSLVRELKRMARNMSCFRAMITGLSQHPKIKEAATNALHKWEAVPQKIG